MSEEQIGNINTVIAHYFEDHPKVDWIPVKNLMPALVSAGIFTKDQKKGLPMRKILRALDEKDLLHKIPTVHAERRSENVYWYVVRPGEVYTPEERISAVSKKEQNKRNIENSDEYYLVSLIDELLQDRASRKHIFDSLVGKLHKRGKGRTKLPLDAYYEGKKLVILFVEEQPEIQDRDANEKARFQQINYYRELKKKAVRKKELSLLEIKYASFDRNDQGKLERNTQKDQEILKGMLKSFLNQ